MKKILLLSLGFVIITFSSGMAKEVKKEDARKVAINAYFEKVNQYDQGISFTDVIVTYEHTTYHNGIPAYFAFEPNSSSILNN